MKKTNKKQNQGKLNKLLIGAVSALLILAIVVTAICVINIKAKANDDKSSVEPLNIGIISDLQVVAEEEFVKMSDAAYYGYMNDYKIKRPIELSLAILKTAVDKLIASDVDVALIIGDITEFGTVASLEAAKAELLRLKSSGIPTYIVNGICDSDNPMSIFCPEDGSGVIATKQDFAEIFADFGYADAVERDTESLSYAVDIPNTSYRLIVIDGAFHGSGRRVELKKDDEKIVMSLSEENWIKNALGEGQNAGKELIAMTNIPLSKYPLSFYNELCTSGYDYIANGNEVQNILMNYNVKYLFCGHIHAENTLSINGSKGTLVEEYTSSICSYPGSIKYFSINKDNSFSKKTVTLDKIPEGYLPSYIAEEVKAQVTSDMASYYRTRYYEDIVRCERYNAQRKGIDLYVTYLETGKEGVDPGEYMLTYFFKKVDLYPTGNPENDGEIEKLAEDVFKWMESANQIPLYGSNSVKSLANSFDSDIPYVERMKDFSSLDFLMDVFLRMYDGAFATSDEDVEILMGIFGTQIYKLGDVDLFDRLHAIYPDIMVCDGANIAERFFRTGYIDLTEDGFLLAFVSLFYPYIENNTPLRVKFTDMKSLLSGFATVAPVLKIFMPELADIIPSGTSDTTYIDLKTGQINAKPFFKNVLIPIFSKSAISL